MNRETKADVVNAFTEQITRSPFILITEFKGTKVSDINQLRRELEKNGMKFQVIKNSLAYRAFASQGGEGLEKHLKGMTGIVFSSPDAVASARVLKDVLKPFATIQVKGGFFDSSVLEADAVKVVSEMPGREELYALLLATVQAGPQNLVSVISAPARDLLQVLANYETKLAEAASAEAAS